MSDRITQLEALAQLKTAGEITNEEFTARKAGILGLEPAGHEQAAMSDDDVQRVWGKFIGLIGMALGAALFYFNGWAITKVSSLYGLGTDLGFFIGPSHGAYAMFLRVGEGWVGLARSNIDALLIDAPMLNAIGLVAAMVFGFEGFKSFLWPERHRREDGA